MPADHKVSVAWQIVALFIPIANFWAFYRIRKLRRYLAYVYLPSLAISIALVAYYYWSVTSFTPWGDNGLAFGEAASPYDFVLWYRSPFIIAGIISWALFGFSVYLVIKWSREHNRKFDQPTTQQVS